MRHEKTKKMQDYWMQLWLESGMVKDHFSRLQWPERNAVQPMHCPELLGDMFILDITNGDSIYRLAGTRLCALLGRELKGETFAQAFDDPDQHAAESWATGLAQDDYLVLICSDGYSADGRIVPMETLMMPLNHNGARGQRALGLTVPLEMPAWLLSQGIVHQTIRSVRILRPWDNTEGKDNVLRPMKTTRATGVQSPSLQMEIDDHRQPEPALADHALADDIFDDQTFAETAPLIDDNGAVRGAPFLRVYEGGRE